MRSPSFHWPRFLRSSTRSKRLRTLRLPPRVDAARRLRCCDIKFFPVKLSPKMSSEDTKINRSRNDEILAVFSIDADLFCSYLLITQTAQRKFSLSGFIAGTMRVFPSIPASIVTGAIVIPLCVAGMYFITATLPPGVLRFGIQLLLATVAFFAPILFSTMGLKHIRSRQRELGGDIFTPPMSRRDFAEIYVPAWIRIGALLLSALFSMLILEKCGVTL